MAASILAAAAWSLRRAQGEVVLFHLLVEQGAVDAKELGGARLVEVGLLEGRPDNVALRAGLRLPERGLPVPARSLPAALHIERQIRQTDGVALEAVHAALENIHQLAGVAGPFAATQGAFGLLVDGEAVEVRLLCRLRQKVMGDGGNVRRGLNKDLAFTEAARVEDIRRIVEVARLTVDACLKS